MDVSLNLRTDIVSLSISMRSSITPQGLRQRLAGILQISHDRLKVYNQDGEIVPEHLGVPTHVRVHHAWERDSATHDVLDVTVDRNEQVKFLLKVDQLWDHQQ